MPEGEPEQLRAIQFFQEQTIPILAAFSNFTERFWKHFVQQMSHNEASVRHMTIALATRQEADSCPPAELYGLSRIRSNAFSSALKLLTQPQPQIDTLSVLMCCLLLVGYEAFQDPFEMDSSSVSHLGAGLRILQDHSTLAPCPSTNSHTEAMHMYLKPMFFQMEMMLCMFKTPIVTHFDRSSSIYQEQPKLPRRFVDLISARNMVFRICRWQFAYRAQGTKAWTSDSPAFRLVRFTFLEWHKLIMLFNDTLSSTDLEQRQNLITMISHWRLLMVSFVHSTATPLHNGTGSPFLPDGGRLKTSLVDLSDPSRVKVTFIVDKMTLPMLQICDWTEAGLPCDPALRIWPIADVRVLEDGRGLVRLIMHA